MKHKVGTAAVTFIGAFALAILAGIFPMGENSRIVEADSHKLQFSYDAERETPQTEVDPLEATKAYVDEAIAAYRADPEAALAYYRTKESFVNDPPGLYLLLLKGSTIVVNGAFPAAENTDISWRHDPLGNKYGVKLVAADEDGTAVEYLIPVSSQNYTFRKKTAWAIRANVPDIDNPNNEVSLVFSAGWLDLEEDVETTFTKAQKAVSAAIEARARIQAETAIPTIDHYKTADSIDGEFYVWIAYGTGRIIADATMPELVGMNVADAYPEVGAEILAVQPLTERWISHMWQNPATGQVELKHTYVTRFFGIYIVSGYYDDATDTEPCVTAIDGAGTYTGSWDDDDCLSQNRPRGKGGQAGADYYARFFTLTLKQASDVTINLTSDKDTYLYLLEGSGRDGATEDENDDITSGVHNSHIAAPSLDAGTYTIEATTYEPKIDGNFTLVVEIESAEPPTPTPPAAEYTTISSGSNHICAIATDGSIMCWGNEDGDSHGQVADRPTSGSFTQISSGENHTCALREDGAVLCWGSIELP